MLIYFISQWDSITSNSIQTRNASLSDGIRHHFTWAGPIASGCRRRRTAVLRFNKATIGFSVLVRAFNTLSNTVLFTLAFSFTVWPLNTGLGGLIGCRSSHVTRGLGIERLNTSQSAKNGSGEALNLIYRYIYISAIHRIAVRFIMSRPEHQAPPEVVCSNASFPRANRHDYTPDGGSAGCIYRVGRRFYLVFSDAWWFGAT